jgi:hypothetical protein
LCAGQANARKTFITLRELPCFAVKNFYNWTLRSTWDAIYRVMIEHVPYAIMKRMDIRTGLIIAILLGLLVFF